MKMKRLRGILVSLCLILICVVLLSTCASEDDKKTNELETTQVPVVETFPVPHIENTVIYEGHDVVISTTGIEKDGSGWEVGFLIENDSTLNLGFNAHSYAVNGIMTGESIYSMDCDVAAGKKANAKLKIKGSFIKEYEITEIRCIDILFWAYDNDKLFKAFDTDQIEIKTDLYDGGHNVIRGEVLYNENDVEVSFLRAEKDVYHFGIRNLSGSYLDLDLEELTINDFTSSQIDFDLMSIGILDQCQAVAAVNVTQNFKTENAIESVESIEFNLELRSLGSYSNHHKIGPIVYTVQ